MPVPVKSSSSFSFKHLNSLKRKDLLQLCKDHGIKATGKNSELIEKLMELPSTELEVPKTPSSKAAMKETLDAIQRTPLHSIMASAKKTGLPASPMRVPFALSPMALAGKMRVGTPGSVIAKEPSQAIKEAFALEDTKDSCHFPALTNKRQYEEADEASSDSDVEMSPTRQKIARLELPVSRSTFDDLLSDERDPIMQSPSMIDDSISRGREAFGSPAVEVVPDDEAMDEEKEVAECNSSDYLYMKDATMTEATETVKMTDIASTCNPTDESTASISESMDSVGSLHQSSSRTSLNQSHSFSSASRSSSASSNPLLPSGIVKLLEKKRQEGGGMHAMPANGASVQKKKFDLQESLKRPLSYKPHTGPLNKKP